MAQYFGPLITIGPEKLSGLPSGSAFGTAPIEGARVTDVEFQLQVATGVGVETNGSIDVYLISAIPDETGVLWPDGYQGREGIFVPAVTTASTLLCSLPVTDSNITLTSSRLLVGRGALLPSLFSVYVLNATGCALREHREGPRRKRKPTAVEPAPLACLLKYRTIVVEPWPAI